MVKMIHSGWSSGVMEWSSNIVEWSSRVVEWSCGVMEKQQIWEGAQIFASTFHNTHACPI